MLSWKHSHSEVSLSIQSTMWRSVEITELHIFTRIFEPKFREFIFSNIVTNNWSYKVISRNIFLVRINLYFLKPFPYMYCGKTRNSVTRKFFFYQINFELKALVKPLISRNFLWQKVKFWNFHTVRPKVNVSK